METFSLNSILSIEGELSRKDLSILEKLRKRALLTKQKEIAERKRDFDLLKTIESILNSYTLDYLIEEEIKKTQLEYGE